jgi:hypothetical protein
LQSRTVLRLVDNQETAALIQLVTD